MNKSRFEKFSKDIIQIIFVNCLCLNGFVSLQLCYYINLSSQFQENTSDHYRHHEPKVRGSFTSNPFDSLVQIKAFLILLLSGTFFKIYLIIQLDSQAKGFDRKMADLDTKGWKFD